MRGLESHQCKLFSDFVETFKFDRELLKRRLVCLQEILPSGHLQTGFFNQV